MFNLKYRLCAGALVLGASLAGCTSLAPSPADTLVAPTEPSACESKNEAKLSALDKELCAALVGARNNYSSYAQNAQAHAATNTFFGYQQIASAVAVAGFSLFGAHADNTKAATLIGSLGAIGSAQLKPGPRSEVYADAAQAAGCAHDTGRLFLGAGDITPKIDETINWSLERRLLVAALKLDSTADAGTALWAENALKDLQTQIEASRGVMDNRRAAPEKVRETIRIIASTSERLLKAQAPNMEELIKAVTQLGKSAAPAAPTNPPAAQGGALTPTQRLQQIADEAAAHATYLKNATGAPGANEVQAIAKCIEQFE